jgi:uncharacterized protein GlcG (DUF336 family)/mannose-6-phosphate isomerase-like protein (cupin superfamily)
MHCRRAIAVLLAGACLTLPTVTSAEAPTRAVERADVASVQSLNHAGARRVIAAAVAAAHTRSAGGAIAVVDAGGNLMAVERLDGTFAAGANISIGKARTAALFRKPTAVFETIIRDGRTPMIALDDFTPLQGGVPIIIDGEVVGAIGVSGAASAQQDEEIALAGAKALEQPVAAAQAPEADVTHLPADRVASAFEKGAVLHDALRAGYAIHASRRVEPGQAEVHVDETDVIHVLQGSAVFVTGGVVVDPTQITTTEIRGASIAGGIERHLKPGDVITVPAGIPHWFKQVDGPVHYFVVKVRAAATLAHAH